MSPDTPPTAEAESNSETYDPATANGRENLELQPDDRDASSMVGGVALDKAVEAVRRGTGDPDEAEQRLREWAKASNERTRLNRLDLP